MMGIWPHDSDGTDINAVDVSGSLVATADDFGHLKLFNYPCVAKSAPFVQGNGHSSHIMGVRFVKGAGKIATVGGCDRSVMLWNVRRKSALIEDRFKRDALRR